MSRLPTAVDTRGNIPTMVITLTEVTQPFYTTYYLEMIFTQVNNTVMGIFNGRTFAL